MYITYWYHLLIVVFLTECICKYIHIIHCNIWLNTTGMTHLKITVSLFEERMPRLGHCLDDRGIGIRYYSLYRQEISLDSNAFRWAFWTMGTWGGESKNERGVKPKIQRPENIRRATLRSLVARVTWQPGLLKNASNTKTVLMSKKSQGLVLMRIY